MKSVRFKIVFGFFLILLPVIAFLIYNNLYAMRIVQDQISSHYDALLREQVANQDRQLKAYLDYMNRLEREPDLQNIQALTVGTDDYTLAKISLRNRMALDLNANESIDTLFVYPQKEGDLFFATELSFNAAVKREALLAWAEEHATKIPTLPGILWDHIVIDGEHYVMKAVDLGFTTIAGTLVNTERFQERLASFDVGPDGGAFLVDSAGNKRVDSAFGPFEDAAFRRMVASVDGVRTGLKYEGQSYLVISRASAVSDIRYVLVTTEAHILKNLPFFQKVLNFWIPLTAAGVLTLYLAFLQRVVFQPLVRLIRGMRKLGQGQLGVRLPKTEDSSEFAFMTGTFNQMAEQIEKLKIDVYEEQIRLQKAEYKHLQIQINPHFYMNSLNIIYSLAALKDYKSVQKLSLHLAEYFRFLMLGHRSVVRLEDEIRHIEHYLEIQKLRYGTKLEYAIEADARHLGVDISPLLLQPFVENSVIHGFNKRKQDGTPFVIRIRSEDDAEEPGRYIRLTLADNGPGFPEEMLAALTDGTYAASPEEQQHLGIWNVLRRFRMLYGGDGGIAFRNAPEGGATVEVRLPVGSAAARAMTDAG